MTVNHVTANPPIGSPPPPKIYENIKSNTNSQITAKMYICGNHVFNEGGRAKKLKRIDEASSASIKHRRMNKASQLLLISLRKLSKRHRDQTFLAIRAM